MNSQIVSKIEQTQMRKVPELRPGDIVRVHQKIKEGNKERIQVFEGVVLKVTGSGVKETFLVRKISFEVGVEKSYPIHSPNIAKIEVKKRSKVRKGYLTYLRNLTGKSARLKDKQFDMLAVNVVEEPKDTKDTETKEPHKKEEKKAEKKTEKDEKLDADITELSEEQIADAEADEVPIEEVAAAENREADKEDKEGSDSAEVDHQVAEIEEVQAGITKAENETPGQSTEGTKAEKVKEATTEEELKEDVAQEKEDHIS